MVPAAPALQLRKGVFRLSWFRVLSFAFFMLSLLSAGHRPSRGNSDSVACASRRRDADLFREAREVIIVHHGEQYRLRITRAGKLMLTK